MPSGTTSCQSSSLVDVCDNCLPCAAVLPCLCSASHHGSCTIHLLLLCVYRVVPCCQELFPTHDLTKSSARMASFMMKIVSDMSAPRMRSTRSCCHEAVFNVCKLDEARTLLRHHA